MYFLKIVFRKKHRRKSLLWKPKALGDIISHDIYITHINIIVVDIMNHNFKIRYNNKQNTLLPIKKN